MTSFSYSEWSDAQLVDTVARQIAIPREAPANSFVLHAPLELTARAALLPMVNESNRIVARSRIADMAAEYERFSPPAPDPAVRSFDSLNIAAEYLAAAVDASDLESADAAARFLAGAARPHQLGALLAPTVLPSLAAAAHGSIFLYLLPRVAPRGGDLAHTLRPLVRELARNSALRMQWVSDQDFLEMQPEAVSLRESLQHVPQLGIPGSSFIFPIMHQAEQNQMASNLLAGPVAAEALGDAARVLLRAAALSMLAEPTTHSAYGWSHCLTMTQGALGTAPSMKKAAVAVAATYVVGFRAALSAVDLPTRFVPTHEVTPADVVDVGRAIAALDVSPQSAAAVMWLAPEEFLDDLTAVLVNRAAVHADAHLVKYTLACLDAAAFDGEQRRLYFAAMAFLNTLWLLNPEISF